jgi:hypothetical protein
MNLLAEAATTWPDVAMVAAIFFGLAAIVWASNR